MAARQWLNSNDLATLLLVEEVTACYVALTPPDRKAFKEALRLHVEDTNIQALDLDGITVTSILRTWHADSDVPVMRLLG